MPVVTVSLQSCATRRLQSRDAMVLVLAHLKGCVSPILPSSASEVERQAWADPGAPPRSCQPCRGRSTTRVGCKPQTVMGTVNKGEDAGQLERGYLRAGGSPAVGAGLGVPRGCLSCPELQGEEPSLDISPQATRVTE